MADAGHHDPVHAIPDVEGAVLHVRRRIGSRIHRRRRQLKLSQEELAEHVGFSPNYIAHLERGSRGISLATLVRLARGLRTSLAHLLAPHGRARGAGEVRRGPAYRGRPAPQES